MTKSIAFSPTVLSSDRNLENFLYGKRTLEGVKAQSKSAYVSGEGKMGPLEVTWIVLTSPYRTIFAVFVKATGYLVLLFDSQQAQKLFVFADHIEEKSLRWVYHSIHGDNLLVDTLNSLAVDAHDVYGHPSISLKKIPDKRVRDRFHYYKDKTHLHFQKGIGSGQCYGESEFFAHLYFQTRRVFRNVEHHLVTLSKIFIDGAPSEAALWQLAQGENVERPILKLQKRLVKDTKEPTVEKVQKIFKHLTPGFYAVRTIYKNNTSHRVNLIQEQKQTYVFDANRGLVNSTSPEEKSRLQERLSNCARLIIYRMNQPLLT